MQRQAEKTRSQRGKLFHEVYGVTPGESEILESNRWLTRLGGGHLEREGLDRVVAPNTGRRGGQREMTREAYKNEEQRGTSDTTWPCTRRKMVSQKEDGRTVNLRGEQGAGEIKGGGREVVHQHCHRRLLR